MNKKVTKKEEVDLIFVKIIHNIGSLSTIYIGMDCRERTNIIHLLEHHLYKIHWSSLSANPSTIHILETNLDKSICVESLKILPSLRIVIYETLQT